MDNNPVISAMDHAMQFLLPRATKTAKIIGSSLGLSQSLPEAQKQADQLHASSARLIKRAQDPNLDPAEKQRLLKVARDADAQATQNINDLVDYATKDQGLTENDYKENPAVAGVKTGLDVGALLAPVGEFGKAATVGGTVAKNAGALALNSLTGAARQYANSDQAMPDLADETKAAIGSNVGAGLVQGAGKVLTKGTKKVAEGIYNGIIKEPLKKETQQAIKTGSERIGSKALNNGTAKGLTDQSIYNNSVQSINSLEDQLQEKLSNSKRVVPISSIREAVDPYIQKLNKAGSATGQAIQDRLDRMEQFNGKSIPISVANEIKRTLYDEARNAYGSQGSENIEGIKQIAKGLKDAIASKVDGVNEINQKLSEHGKIADSLLEKMTKDARKAGVSLTDYIVGAGGLMTGNPLNSVVAIGAKKALSSTPVKKITADVLQKTGNAAENIGANTPLPNLLEKGGQLVGSDVSQASASLKPTPNTNNSNDQQQPTQSDHNTPYSNTDQPQSQYVDDNSMDATFNADQAKKMSKQQILQKAMLWDLQNNGGKNIAKLKTMYDTYASTQKPLSATQQTNKANAESGLKALDTIQSELNDNPNVMLKDAIPGKLGARTYEAARKEASDVLTRLRTGAALNADEQRFYQSQLPAIGDSPKDIQYKLNLFRQLFLKIAYGQVPADNTPTMPDMTTSTGQ